MAVACQGLSAAAARRSRRGAVVEAAHERDERVAPDSLLVAGGEHPPELERGEPFAKRVEPDRRLRHGPVREAVGLTEPGDALMKPCECCLLGWPKVRQSWLGDGRRMILRHCALGLEH